MRDKFKVTKSFDAKIIIETSILPHPGSTEAYFVDTPIMKDDILEYVKSIPFGYVFFHQKMDKEILIEELDVSNLSKI